jgi:threonine/homoserine/homoserine lactone efflux protein
MEFSSIVQFLTASVLLTLSPGPDILYVLSSALRRGFAVGFSIALGLCSGLVVHTALVGLGAAKAIEHNLIWQWIFKVFGAAYMLFLAYKVYKSPAQIELNDDVQPVSRFGRLYAQGFLMNVLNPKVSLFFLAFLPQFINADGEALWTQAMFLGLLFFAQALLVFSLVSFFAGKLAAPLSQNIKLQEGLKYFQVLLFVVLAVGILLM